MAILEVKDLKFSYENDGLYNSVSFQLNLGEHAVLVGPNGCGKSTFMKIISSKLHPDKGTVEWLNGINYAYLDQQLEVNKNEPIIDYLEGVYKDLFEKEKQLNKLYEDASLEEDFDKQMTLFDRAESLREYLELHDFYNIQVEINNVVQGLGLNKLDLNTDLKRLSGGEKAKVYLAKLLLEKPDCLLMDEPTNFLDKSHVDWLIEYLKNFKGTFLVISHDQEFLRGIAELVYAIENKSISRYKGNFDYYLQERVVRFEIQKNAYNRQQNMIRQTEIFIQKNLARASTTKMAQSRRKKLEKLDIIEKPTEEYHPHINFPFSKNLGVKALELKDLEIGYNNPLLPPITILVKQNERVEIIGKNGIGKTTLIKTLLGLLEPLSGEFKFGPSVDINYFSQEEEFNKEDTPMDYIRRTYPDMTNNEVMATLAPLGIKGDLARKPMYELSGGEQCRVRLSLMTLKKSNFLVLDEPTNHLDKLTKDVLHDAIDDFPGCVILVSHEKGFADDLVDYVIKF